MQVMSIDEDVMMSVPRARRHLILYLLMDYCLLSNNLLYVFNLFCNSAFVGDETIYFSVWFFIFVGTISFGCLLDILRMIVLMVLLSGCYAC